ncbi:MAG: Phosphoribosylamine--glycine ligase [Anaerolineales bacterium]|nr:Phosphoribosylamine--glycine ligase [Anaerolineales bacterium]
MNVLIIGSGGREHAITWKVCQSPKADKVFVLPGNPGTGQIATNVDDVSVEDHGAVASFCKINHVDLVIIGPEAPLAAGLADSLSGAGIRCFGPSQAAARIEASKSFAKDFMARHHIPTAKYATFSSYNEAARFLESVDYPIVIKASGLAAGKGVILPDTLDEAKSALADILVKKVFGEAGAEVIIEERMTGQEVSLMAFTDGRSVKPMIPAQDHKRIFDGDKGANTGGMGAYAPAPIFTSEMMNEAMENVLQPAVRGMKSEGNPFVGILYAGLMLTPNGLRVLEFNCRFGDPETQVALPLLETDLLDVAEACVNGNLADIDARWKSGAAVCVVLASRGYPEKAENGKVVTFGELPENMVCFHAGTKMENGNIITAGGRVFGLTAWAEDIKTAVHNAYANIEKISFDGVQYRKDIAGKALNG